MLLLIKMILWGYIVFDYIFKNEDIQKNISILQN